MKRAKYFVKTTILGGIIVLLPIGIIVFLADWMIGFITDLIQPLVDYLTDTWEFREYVADAIVITVIVIALFLIGIVVRTKFGDWVYRFIEKRILKVFPGYSTITQAVVEFIGTDRPPFSSVALVRVSGDDALETAFVTDIHPDGSYTVFIPTGPNPTSGNIYHLPSKSVHEIDVPVEEAWRSVVSCGAGSQKLVEAYRKSSGDIT